MMPAENNALGTTSLFRVTEIGYPNKGPLTQGTIFVGGRSVAYPDCDVSGIVITARCDVANDKVESYNYLPIVKFNDWIHQDGRYLLADRLRVEAYSSLKALLRENQHAASILDSQSLDSIRDVLFPAAEDKKSQAARKRFEDYSRKYELALKALASQPEEHLCKLIVKEAPHLRDALIKELFGYRLGGNYFLRRIEPQGDDLGFVVLLREIQMIPRSLALAVAEGLDANTFSLICEEDPSLKNRLQISPNGYAMPIGILNSPNIEHLMQSFSMLFGRIGIVDYDAAYINSVWTRQPSFGSGDEKIHSS